MSDHTPERKADTPLPPEDARTRSVYAAGAPEMAARHRALEAIWGTPPGIPQFSVVNHNIIGRRFIVTSLAFFVIGGLLAMLIRVQLASPDAAFMEPGLYAQVFTMHGTIMMFLFAIPLFEGIAIYFLPKLLGSRDLAFPRLSAFGYWCYLFGGLMLLGALAAGVAPDGGWFMYTPLSSLPWSPGINADVWLLGVTFVEISAVSAAVELLVTVLRVRAPGMSLDRMPIFAWYMLIVGGMMLIGFPPLILGSILLEVERAFDLPFFDPLRGGDPLLWQHLFWLFGHPEVYIIFLPAAGAISTILPVFAGRPLVGYRLIVAAIVAMAFLSFGLWVHHMYATGLPHLSLAFFSAASALVAVPTAVQIFAWLATLAHGRPRLSIPMLHIFGFFVVFVAGGLTGVMLAMVPFDLQAHDTHFVVAHLHYVLVGGFLFPMMAAGYYWLPHFCGRMPEGGLSRIAFWLIFGGFNGTFFMMHLTGLLGMPRRVAHYPDDAGWSMLNLLSSLGSFVMAIGIALVIADFILTMRFGKRTRPDPWQAGTLEWAVGRLPAPSYNFAALPAISVRADQIAPQNLGRALALGQGYLAKARNHWQETAGSDMITGAFEHIIILPRQSYAPFFSALAVGSFFLAMLFKVYWAIPLSVLAIVATFLAWPPTTAAERDRGLMPAGQGLDLPLHPEVARPPTWWGMVFTLAADLTLFVSLLFGALFLWLAAPNWPPPGNAMPQMIWLALAAAGLVVAAIGGRVAVRQVPRIVAGLLICAAGYALALGATCMLMAGVPAPTAHAANAARFVVLAYGGFHAGVGLVFVAIGFVRRWQGVVSARRAGDLRIGQLWHDYTAVTGIVALGFVALFAVLAGGGAG